MRKREAEKALLKMAGDKYCSTKEEKTFFSKHESHKRRVETVRSVYITGFFWHSGGTWEECLENLREEMDL